MDVDVVRKLKTQRLPELKVLSYECEKLKQKLNLSSKNELLVAERRLLQFSEIVNGILYQIEGIVNATITVEPSMLETIEAKIVQTILPIKQKLLRRLNVSSTSNNNESVQLSASALTRKLQRNTVSFNSYFSNCDSSTAITEGDTDDDYSLWTMQNYSQQQLQPPQQLLNSQRYLSHINVTSMESLHGYKSSPSLPLSFSRDSLSLEPSHPHQRHFPQQQQQHFSSPTYDFSSPLSVPLENNCGQTNAASRSSSYSSQDFYVSEAEGYTTCGSMCASSKRSYSTPSTIRSDDAIVRYSDSCQPHSNVNSTSPLVESVERTETNVMSPTSVIPESGTCHAGNVTVQCDSVSTDSTASESGCEIHTHYSCDDDDDKELAMDATTSSPCSSATAPLVTYSEEYDDAVDTECINVLSSLEPDDAPKVSVSASEIASFYSQSQAASFFPLECQNQPTVVNGDIPVSYNDCIDFDSVRCQWQEDEGYPFAVMSTKRKSFDVDRDDDGGSLLEFDGRLGYRCKSSSSSSYARELSTFMNGTGGNYGNGVGSLFVDASSFNPEDEIRMTSKRRKRLGQIVPNPRKPRSADYNCSVCNEMYTKVAEENPWWAVYQHECPKCHHRQVPRYDINLASNAIEIDPNVVALYGEGIDDCDGGNGGIDGGDDYVAYDDEDDDGCVDEADGAHEDTVGEGEIGDSPEVSRKVEDMFNGEGGNLTVEQASKLFILMTHARTCDGKHAHDGKYNVCVSTKLLMLHVRDCAGVDIATGRPCQYEWCLSVKKSLRHLTRCVEPSHCAVCRPWSLTEPYCQLSNLNDTRTFAVSSISDKKLIYVSRLESRDDHILNKANSVKKQLEVSSSVASSNLVW